jgi:hypothetical protein
MKAEDPAIQIGANGDTGSWWKAVLTAAAEHIDFLSVHSYPCWKWAGYEQYRTNHPDILGTVRVAADALAEYAPAHKNRIKIMLTEFAAGTFGEWDDTPSDLGRALITFDLQGQLLQERQVQFSQFWNTHNIYSEVDGGVFDALMRDNTLSPIGRALSIWNHFLGDEMAATTSSEFIRCFAGTRAGRQLAVFLVNKDTASREAAIVFRNSPAELTRGQRWVLHGDGPSDRHPKWERIESVCVSDSRVSVLLGPVSLSVIVIEPPDKQKGT